MAGGGESSVKNGYRLNPKTQFPCRQLNPPIDGVKFLVPRSIWRRTPLADIWLPVIENSKERLASDGSYGYPQTSRQESSNLVAATARTVGEAHGQSCTALEPNGPTVEFGPSPAVVLVKASIERLVVELRSQTTRAEGLASRKRAVSSTGMSCHEAADLHQPCGSRIEVLSLSMRNRALGPKWPDGKAPPATGTTQMMTSLSRTRTAIGLGPVIVVANQHRRRGTQGCASSNISGGQREHQIQVLALANSPAATYSYGQHRWVGGTQVQSRGQISRAASQLLVGDAASMILCNTGSHKAPLLRSAELVKLPVSKTRVVGMRDRNTGNEHMGQGNGSQGRHPVGNADMRNSHNAGGNNVAIRAVRIPTQR
ncbi:hypothetical protein ACRE_000510 [Hapsidospora chrysogenum ATCC 11550]|uniref:Uncharacterized protein n=1 Tax=Hapsidospora chrysogenum (strain ATCC 11550 / CBS 779.69 / DSM 880 / IAM 14645 / JCM 23072 / IMI 49137) TaxID=857340 RepID=A0A086THV4_HAPC1|nr:hypothetical protein ACRE_000510 [Hapsidospora chrysogenum ATCC 11550]